MQGWKQAASSYESKALRCDAFDEMKSCKSNEMGRYCLLQRPRANEREDDWWPELASITSSSQTLPDNKNQRSRGTHLSNYKLIERSKQSSWVPDMKTGIDFDSSKRNAPVYYLSVFLNDWRIDGLTDWTFQYGYMSSNVGLEGAEGATVALCTGSLTKYLPREETYSKQSPLCSTTKERLRNFVECRDRSMKISPLTTHEQPSLQSQYGCHWVYHLNAFAMDAVVLCFGFIQTIARHGLVAQTSGTSIPSNVLI